MTSHVHTGIPAHPELRALVGHALAQELGMNHAPPLQHGDVVSSDLVALHRVDLLLTNHQTELTLPAETAEKVKTQAIAHTVAAMKLVPHTLEVSRLLSAHGFDFLLYKGVTLSGLTNRGIASRGAGDVDVLITPTDLPRAHQVLVDEGFRPKVAFVPTTGLLGRFWSYREREASYYKAGISIDLHWRIPKEPSLVAPTETLLGRKVHVSVGDATVPTLHPSDALCATATTVYLDYCQNLRLVVDLVFLGNLEGMALPDDLPKPGRALVSDVLEFTRQLLGKDLVPEIPGTIAPNPGNVSYLTSLWNRNSSGTLLAAGPTQGSSEWAGRLDHWMRYGQGLPTTARFFAWALFAFPDFTASKPSTSLAAAFGLRMKQLFTNDFPYLRERKRASQRPVSSR